MAKFDITLVFFHARLHNIFLNIIKYLASETRVCVFVCPYFKSSRTPETNRQFLEACEELGATVVRDRERIETNLLFLTHVTSLDSDYIENEVLRYIQSRKRYAFQAFGITGGPSGEALFDCGFQQKFVFDKKLDGIRFQTGQTHKWATNRFENIEIGDLNTNYPFLDHAICDYLICIPTKLSFETATSSFIFFRNTFRLISSVERGETIAIKQHTARDEETPLDSTLAKIFGQNRLFLCSLLGWAGLLLDQKFGTRLCRNKIYRDVMKGVFYKKIMCRCEPLLKLHKHARFGAELFLPGVRKGLITGRSSVVWFALKQKLRVFNCDEEKVFSKTGYLNVLNEHYGVPSAGDRLVFNEDLWRKLSQTEFDLIDFIRKDLRSAV